MIINMVGGGGGFSASNAILGITAYAGSTVSISNGTVTKIVTPDKSHVLSDNDDYAIYYFGIPSGMFSSTVAWNVVSTYQTEETTATVIIDTNAFYDVVLTYIIPYDYQRVLYLQSNGTPYIDTLIATDNIGILQMQLMVETPSASSENYYVFGGTESNSSSSASTNKGFGLAHRRQQDGFPVRYSNRSGTVTNTVYFSNVQINELMNFNLSFINGTCDVNNTTKTLTNYSITYTGSFYLFTMHHGNNIVLTTDTYNTNRIYSCDIFNYNNEKISSLIPCYRKSDNVAGMYDNVRKIFLINNNNTGTFVVGSDVTE